MSSSRDEFQSIVFILAFSCWWKLVSTGSAGAVRDPLEQPQVALVLAGHLQSCHTLLTEHD